MNEKCINCENYCTNFGEFCEADECNKFKIDVTAIKCYKWQCPICGITNIQSAKENSVCVECDIHFETNKR